MSQAMAIGQSGATTILGTGTHRYQVVHDWPQTPPGLTWGYTHGVQVDSAGRVYIHHQHEQAVMVFDDAGRFLKSWGAAFRDGAHGMQLRREGDAEFLYFADVARSIVVKTTLDGREVFTLGVPKEAGVYGGDVKYVPTNVAFAPGGDFYVADGYGASYLHQYSSDGRYLRTWGGAGSEPGKMRSPHGIWIDTRPGRTPSVLVADRENNRLQYFSLDGRHLGFVTAELRRPCHFDQRGDELLIPDLCGRVTLFDKDNKLVIHLGDNPDPAQRARPDVPVGARRDGTFCSPHAACWDHQGNIYVVEWLLPGRVTKLRRLADEPRA
jgi:hypothetical protein